MSSFDAVSESPVSVSAGVNSGKLSATFDQQIKFNTGTLGARFNMRLSNAGKLSATFDQQLTNRSGKLSATFNQKLSNTGELSATFDQQIFTQDVSSSRLVNAEILLGGVDISSKITGEVVVEAAEGVARLADFDMLPAVGVIDPYDWINQTVIINFVENGQKSRLFTGVVHLPTFNTNTGITSFKCTDALQETVELTTRNIIDTIVGGWWDSLIFEAKDSWTYALQRLETITASYDLDAYRNPRVTNWQPKAVADYSFTAIVDKSGKFQFAERRSIINSIKLKVDVRFNRLWSKKYSGSWKIPTTFDGWLEKPYGLPAKQMILDSVNGLEVIKAETTGLPDSGFFNLTNSNIHHWTLSEFAKTLARSAYLELKRRWSQTITKTHDITLQSQSSIDKHGLLQLDQTSSISIDNGKDWESDTPENLTNEVVVGAGASIFNDDINYDNAINTIINLQSTKILSSHRKNKYTFDLPLHPAIDLDKTLSVTVPRVDVKGKVSRIKHVISMSRGNAKAISTIDLSLYRPNISGQSSDPLTIDTTLPVPSSAASNLELDTHVGVDFNLPPDDESWNGWVCNYDDPITQQSSTAKPIEVYDERWNLQVPEVPVIERDEEKITQQNIINIAIPQDNSTITQV